MPISSLSEWESTMDIQQMTIAQIKKWFMHAERTEISSYLPRLRSDERSGIRQLLKQWEQKEEQLEQRLKHWNELNREEKQLKQDGVTLIAGVDEVGRGPLAGPVVVAAVILPADFFLLGVNDSKQLKKEEREEFAKHIQEQAVEYSISFIDAKEIDRINIYQATIKAMAQALEELHTPPQFALIDAMKLPINLPHKSIVKGDTKSVSIASASILAKVARDDWMTQMAQLYPQYGFERNMGYGTKEHISALQTYGPTPIHRRTFLTRQVDVLE
jgi:ribonuclease HII